MAYLLRSLAIVGVIALNSPVHRDTGGDAATPDTAATTVAASKPMPHALDLASAAQGIGAAREAAEILAALDPETRGRVLAMLGTGAAQALKRAP